MEDKKFNELMLQINILSSIYTSKQEEKASVGDYSSAHSAQIRVDILNSIMIIAEKIAKS